MNPSKSEELESDMFALRFNLQDDRFVDTSTGLPLDEGVCRAARKKDIDYFIGKGVWEFRTVNEARTKMGRARPYLCAGWRSTKEMTKFITSEVG